MGHSNDVSDHAEPSAERGPGFTDRVSALIRTVAEVELLPRYQTLGADEVREKSAGELVTAADVAAERRLADGLRGILPSARFVGEEAAAADAAVLDRIDGPGDVWVVDPLDGTAHFAVGQEPFGIIVALVADGQTEQGWIYLPRTGAMATATRGGGAYVDGQRVALSTEPTAFRGALLTRFLPDDVARSVEAGRGGLDLIESERCAAQRYIQLITGNEQFALYWRTEPWDHAAGCLLVEEAGGRARRPDGRPFVPGDRTGGLLVASSEQLWTDLRRQLLPPRLQS